MIKEEVTVEKFLTSRFVEVYGSKMHYLEAGEGDPILFLHGIPTSSYVWRNVIPYLSSLGKCIAPDLIGFGQSDKPSIDYSVFDHIKYIEQLIEQLQLKNITLVMHGWGSVIGFDYAMRHENNVKGLVFYEAFLRAFQLDDFSLPYQQHLISMQAEVHLERFTHQPVTFIDTIIPQSVMKQLSTAEMENYRRPFLQEGSGKPIVQFLKELPTDDQKNKVEHLIAHYSNQLTQSPIPKLMLYSIPGFMTTIATAMWAKEHIKNLEIVDLGEELHLAQESSPAVMGETISAWIQGMEAFLS